MYMIDDNDFLKICDSFVGVTKIIEKLKSEILCAQDIIETQAERLKTVEIRNEEFQERIEKSTKKIEELETRLKPLIEE